MKSAHPNSNEPGPLMRRHCLRLGILLLVLVCSVLAQAAPISYQGKLDANGTAFNGNVNLGFRLYESETGGGTIAEITRPSWPVVDGLFQVELDFGPQAFASGVLGSDDRYLEVLVNGIPLEPRQRVTAAPIAITTAAGAIGINQINSAQVQRRIGGNCPAGQYMRRVNEDGTVLCQAETFSPPAWSLGGNSSTDPAVDFLGTIDDRALELRAHNVRSLRLEPSSEQFEGLPITVNVIAGSHVNTTIAGVRGVVIGGGGAPEDYDDLGPSFGDLGPNQAHADFVTIGGGSNNEAGGTAFSQPVFHFGTVGGGLGNASTGTASTVGGGESNAANGSHATVGGGRDNTALAPDSTISGGGQNLATADGATVGGGQMNDAGASWSTVPGGLLNCAGGQSSWAGGRRAKVRRSTAASSPGLGCVDAPTAGVPQGDAGTFVWADSQNEDFVSSGSDQFLVRARGGIGFGRVPSDYFVIDSGRELQDNDYSFGTGALRVLMNDPIGNVVTMFRILGNGGVAVGNSFNSSGVPERGMKIQGRLALQSLGSGGSTSLCRNGDDEVATCGSSTRYKSDIRDLQEPMALIASLRPVRYQWLDGSGNDIGLVAEEVAEQVPELATYADGQVEGVKYDRLAVLLLAVVQQQSRELAALQLEFDSLKSRSKPEEALVGRAEDLIAGNERLSRRNSDLEARLAALEMLLVGED